MDLYSASSPAAEAVNPKILVSVQSSTGYTIGAGLKQVPTYAGGISGYAQVQELTDSDLRQADGLNIQGVMRKIYLPSPLNGAIRPEGTGGDLITIGSQVWLAVKTIEQWPLWCTALIVLQVPV